MHVPFTISIKQGIEGETRNTYHLWLDDLIETVLITET